MDETFKSRVDKVFGSLASSRSSSLWSIADDELERREWRRSADTSGRDETPCSSSFDQLFSKNRRRRSLADEDDGEDEEPACDDQEAWDIRSSIGLDRTLDFEEEEDEFDKVASGRENAGDRLYMRDITEEGSYLNSENVLRKKKDPRANHLAAKFRLKEDDDEAQKLGSDAKASKHESPPKPILKRKDGDADSKARKRVRFDVDTQNAGKEMPRNVSDSDSLPANRASGVPDYLVNPSKYTRYSFDSTSQNDESTFNRVKRVNAEAAPEEENGSSDLPRSVTFVPKRKACEAKPENDSNERLKTLHQEGIGASIAVLEVEGETGEVDKEDEPETMAEEGQAGLQKPGRRYRTTSKPDDSDT